MISNVRFQGVFEGKEEVLDERILLAGAGSVGSSVAVNLLKVGFRNVDIFDTDEVSEENILVSEYRARDIGKSKVKALMGIVDSKLDEEQSWQFFESRVDKNTSYNSYKHIIVTVDNMETRQQIYSSLNLNKEQILVDARMGLFKFELYTMRINKLGGDNFYEHTLVDQDKIEPAPCTMATIGFTSQWLGSLTVNSLVQFLVGDKQDLKAQSVSGDLRIPLLVCQNY